MYVSVRKKKREGEKKREKKSLLLKKCVIKNEIRRNHVFNERQFLFNHGTHATFVKPHRLWKSGKGKKKNVHLMVMTINDLSLNAIRFINGIGLSYED